MRRVVITGMGIWSCIGQNLETVTESLLQGKSGIVFDHKRIEYGLQSGLVGAVPPPNVLIKRQLRENLSDDAKFAYVATQQALRLAKITDDYLKENEVGIIWGNDGNSSMVEHDRIMKEEKDSLYLGSSALFKEETSSPSMNLATIFHLRGVNMTVSSACASSTNAIGVATTFIRQGRQDMIIVGGSASQDIYYMPMYDATLGISTNNNNPQKASRPFDIDRDGIIPSSGGASLILEEYEHAKERGADILAEIIGYGSVCGGVDDIFQPYNEGMYNAMQKALKNAGVKSSDIDVVNSAAPSSKRDDWEEAIALSRLFANGETLISSTESMTGHEGWMAGASETIYSILMMQNGFVAPNINLHEKIEVAKDLHIPNKTIYRDINMVLNNSIGLGNSYSAIILKKV